MLVKCHFTLTAVFQGYCRIFSGFRHYRENTLERVLGTYGFSPLICIQVTATGKTPGNGTLWRKVADMEEDTDVAQCRKKNVLKEKSYHSCSSSALRFLG